MSEDLLLSDRLTSLSIASWSGGQSKALMFAHVSPESGSTSETVSTLNFAARVKQVELGKASQNKGSLAEMKELVRKPVSKVGAMFCLAQNYDCS
jgi:hypothetical protein